MCRTQNWMRLSIAYAAQQFATIVAASVQVNLAPLAAHLEALRLMPAAQISPALDDLYALLGRPVDPAAAGEAEALVAEVLGASPPAQQPLLLPR